MKKVIEGFSLLFLTCFSFYYTDKVINMVNKNDPLMIEIISVKDDYEVLPVNGILNGNTVIPGINGREVDVNKSYNNMKTSGVFREEALVFKNLYPSSSLKDNQDKYIVSGNSTKKEVAILIILNSAYMDKISKIDNVTVFINHSDLTITNINILSSINTNNKVLRRKK